MAQLFNIMAQSLLENSALLLKLHRMRAEEMSFKKHKERE